MHKLLSLSLGITLLLILGCGGGGGDSVQRNLTEVAGTWSQHVEMTGQMDCDGDVQPFEEDYDLVWTIQPTTIVTQEGGQMGWSWSGDDLSIDWSFSLTMGDDPDCGTLLYAYEYHYQVAFNPDKTVGIITGTIDFSMIDDCETCVSHLDLSGSMTKQ